ncbi:Unknown protein [Striga hermonthica]|uniref:Uncharacterized protein n=1 Tax=Striga hermonthica TaxID=68872 RepID=A0A9N7NPI5_STRHE|nr:Unknown protein [Striga hermonthica]
MAEATARSTSSSSSTGGSVVVQKTSESDPIHPRTRTVTTKVLKTKVHVYKQGKGPNDIIKMAWSGGTRTSSRCARSLTRMNLNRSTHSRPNRVVACRSGFNPRNGWSLLTYRDNVVMLMASPM